MLTARAEAAEVSAEMAALLADRRADLGELVAQVGELEAALRRKAAREAARVEAQREGPLASEAADEGGGRGGAPVPRAGDGASRGPERFIETGVTFEGIASWYGPGFGGRTTASGDIFHRDGLTAASRDLPLGTWLRITYLGSEVFVLVNDRGPYIEDRILDLSEGAANAVGLTGLGWVMAEIVLPR